MALTERPHPAQLCEITPKHSLPASGVGPNCTENGTLQSVSCRNERVVDADAVTAVFEQTGSLQIGEVPGHGRLRFSENALDVADAKRAARQEVDDSKTGLVGQGAKETRCGSHTDDAGIDTSIRLDG